MGTMCRRFESCPLYQTPLFSGVLSSRQEKKTGVVADEKAQTDSVPVKKWIRSGLGERLCLI